MIVRLRPRLPPARRARTLVGVAALAVVAGCDLLNLDGLFECQPTTRSMRGRVIDAVTSEPIAGAHVAVAGQPDVTTDARGRFADSVATNTCEYMVHINVSADGYAGGSGWVQFHPEPTIALQPIP